MNGVKTEQQSRDQRVKWKVRQCLLTLHPSLRPPRPGEAGGTGYWTLVGTCSPSTQKRSEQIPPPETGESLESVCLMTEGRKCIKTCSRIIKMNTAHSLPVAQQLSIASSHLHVNKFLPNQQTNDLHITDKLFKHTSQSLCCYSCLKLIGFTKGCRIMLISYQTSAGKNGVLEHLLNNKGL